MEAQRPNQTNMEKHFSPADPHEAREKYIDSLGNMMILDNEDNNNKDNKPLAEAMPYYEIMYAGHWLNGLTSKLFTEYHKDVSIDGINYMVPNEKFFSERGAKLRLYFKKILDRELDTPKITVSQSFK